MTTQPLRARLPLFPIVQDKLNVLSKEISVCKLEYDEMQQKLEADIAALRQRLSAAEAELYEEGNRLGEGEVTVASLKAALSQKDLQLAELNDLLQQQQQRHGVKLTEWQRTREGLESDVSDKATQIIFLEGSLASLKQRLANAEESTLKYENSVAASEAKLAEAVEELRRARTSLATLQAEHAIAAKARDELEEQLPAVRGELDVAHHRADELEEAIRGANAKLAKAEDKNK